MLFPFLLIFLTPLPENIDRFPQSTKILDRNGILLYEMKSGGKKRYLEYEKISKHLINAVISAEDKNFLSHPGIDFLALLRALFLNLKYQEIVSGASTIETQLAKNLLGPDQKRTFSRKIKEALLAFRISSVYSKEKILEKYLNIIFCGGANFGIESASLDYFGKSSSRLDLSESAFLAGIIKSPSNFYPRKNFLKAKGRQEKVLDLMHKNGYISLQEKEASKKEKIEIVPEKEINLAPHFLRQVLNDLVGSWELRVGSGSTTSSYDNSLGAQPQFNTPNPQLPTPNFRKAGISQDLVIKTTLDLALQRKAQEIVERNLEKLSEKNVSNASVLVLENSSSEVLAYLGSVDYYDKEIAGEVDIIKSFRQPGSAVKPFIYAGAFEDGWNGATVLEDKEVRFFTENGYPYTPKNFDNKFRGKIRIRDALANSLNVPAVLALDFIGLDSAFSLLEKFGLKFNIDTPESFGYSLALGSAEVRLLDLVAAYSVFPNEGLRREVSYLLSIEGIDEGLEMGDGGWNATASQNICHSEEQGDEESLVGNATDDPTKRSFASLNMTNSTAQSQKSIPHPPSFNPHLSQSGRVISSQSAFLISDILYDAEARISQFGVEAALDIKERTAFKTGTTRNFRDSWIIGFNEDVTVGVWVGNADGSPMQEITGFRGAFPIFRDFMNFYNKYRDFSSYFSNSQPPQGILKKKVCLKPEENPCQGYREEFFQTAELQKKTEEEFNKKEFPGRGGEYKEGLAENKREEFTKITFPFDGDVFKIDDRFPIKNQKIIFKGEHCDQCTWFLNNEKISSGKSFTWLPRVGEWVFSLDGQDEVRIRVE